MKKKILWLSLGTAVTAVAALYCTFGGLPVRQIVEKKYAVSVNVTAAAYPYADTAVPSEYVPVEKYGIQVMVPPGLHAQDSDPESVKSRTFVNDEKTIVLLIEDPYDFGPFDTGDPENGQAIRFMNRFCSSIGREPLKNWCDYYDMLLHITADDCNIHSVTQARAFERVAQMKDEIPFIGNGCWDWQTASGEKGYIRRMYDQEAENIEEYRLMAEFYDSETGNIAYDVLICAPELETCCRVVNSITFAKQS